VKRKPKEAIPMKCATCCTVLATAKTKGGKWWCPKCQRYEYGKGPEALAQLFRL